MSEDIGSYDARPQSDEPRADLNGSERNLEEWLLWSADLISMGQLPARAVDALRKAASTFSARRAENRINKVRIDIICMALDDAAEYFYDRLDIRDGADGQQAPNEEMKLRTEIKCALHSLNGIRLSLERAVPVSSSHEAVNASEETP